MSKALAIIANILNLYYRPKLKYVLIWHYKVPRSYSFQSLLKSELKSCKRHLRPSNETKKALNAFISLDVFGVFSRLSNVKNFMNSMKLKKLKYFMVKIKYYIDKMSTSWNRL